MTLLAAWKALLAAVTGQHDVRVGSPWGGRGHLALEPLVGPFIETLVLRTDLAGNPPFRRLVARVRDTVLGALAHQDLPFDRLVDALHPGRDPGRAPLYQVWFVLQSQPMPRLAAAGLRIAPAPSRLRTTKFELALNLAETGGGIAGRIEYDAGLFAPATIAGLAAAYQALLAAAAAEPDLPLAELAARAAAPVRKRPAAEPAAGRPRLGEALRVPVKGSRRRAAPSPPRKDALT